MGLASRLVSWLVVAALPVAAGRAADFCPQNESELRTALAAAQSNGQPDTIRLLATTYFTGGVKFSASLGDAQGLAISGGWSNQSPFLCLNQLPSASATVLDAQGSSAVLEINQAGGAIPPPGTVIRIENLTLRNGLTAVNGESAALAVFGTLFDQTIRVERVIVLDSRQTTVGPNIYTNVITLAGFGDIYLLDSLLSGAQSNYASLGVFSFTDGATVYLTNNTLRVGGAPLQALLDANAGSNFRLVNNALQGELLFNSRNGGDPIQASLLHNVGQWGIAGFSSYNLVSSINNQFAIDPRFVGAGNFRPGPGSPLVNAGLNAPFGGVPGVDLDGGPRVVYETIDVGAYESSAAGLFANGFE